MYEAASLAMEAVSTVATNRSADLSGSEASWREIGNGGSLMNSLHSGQAESSGESFREVRQRGRLPKMVAVKT